MTFRCLFSCIREMCVPFINQKRSCDIYIKSPHPTKRHMEAYLFGDVNFLLIKSIFSILSIYTFIYTQCRRYKSLGFNPCVRKISWRRVWQPTPGFCPWSLSGYGPQSCKESDTTEMTQHAYIYMHIYKFYIYNLKALFWKEIYE